MTTASRSRPGRFAVALALALGLCLGLIVGERAWAYFSDSAQLSTGELTSHQVVSQAQPTCTDHGGIVGLLGYSRLGWTHVDPRYEYRWEAKRVNNGAVIGSGTVSPTGAAGTPASADITPTLLDLGGLAGLQIDVSVTARLKGATGWTAPPTTTRVRSVNLLVVGLSIRCGAG